MEWNRLVGEEARNRADLLGKRWRAGTDRLETEWGVELRLEEGKEKGTWKRFVTE